MRHGCPAAQVPYRVYSVLGDSPGTPALITQCLLDRRTLGCWVGAPHPPLFTLTVSSKRFKTELKPERLTCLYLCSWRGSRTDNSSGGVVCAARSARVPLVYVTCVLQS